MKSKVISSILLLTPLVRSSSPHTITDFVLLSCVVLLREVMFKMKEERLIQSSVSRTSLFGSEAEQKAL